MSTIKTLTIDTQSHKNYRVHLEAFQSAAEVVSTCKGRDITDSNFREVETTSDWKWCGVESYEDAMDMMRTGYQPAVDEFKASMKNTRLGDGKRIAFRNNVVGFAPVVPLVLKNVPNSMVDIHMKPIKQKVVDVYYDVTASAGTDSTEIIARGQKLLGAVRDLEMSGYRVGIYGVQTYSDQSGCDMLIVKLKSSNQPVDLKRISFPLIHTGFFRVIGFDWYSKMPGGTYRSAYGSALAYNLKAEELQQFADQAFGKNSIFLTGVRIGGMTDEKLKEVIRDGDRENM